MRTAVLVVVAAPALLAAGSAAAPDAYRDLVAADNPLLWYRMSEPAGSPTVANDGTLGASHDGVLSAGVTLGAPSAGGDTAAAFEFALEPRITSAGVAPASLTGNPTFTAETVVFIPSSGPSVDYAPFLHWGAPVIGQSVFFSFWFNENNRVYCGFYDGGLVAECTFRLDDWNHIVWVRDSGGGVNDAFTGSRLFVNGIEESLTPDTLLIGFAGPPTVTSTEFRVQRSTNRARHFEGTVDEVVLYGEALSPGQITSRFEALGINPPAVCLADLDNSCGVLDLADINLFITGFVAQDPIADLAEPFGVFDLADIAAFVAAFNAGCP